jgi:hypothetical protein
MLAGSAYFSDMVPINTASDSTAPEGCRGLYVTTGGVVVFSAVATPAGTYRTATFPDNFFVPGFVAAVRSGANGTTAAGLFWLV